MLRQRTTHTPALTTRDKYLPYFPTHRNQPPACEETYVSSLQTLLFFGNISLHTINHFSLSLIFPGSVSQKLFMEHFNENISNNEFSRQLFYKTH